MKILILTLSILFCWQDCFCEPLRIYTFNVYQGNFNLIRHGQKALVYDCGVNLTRRNLEAKVRNCEFGLRDCLDGVNEIRILVSHNDSDHYNLIPALVFCINSLNRNKREEDYIRIIPPAVGSIFQNYALLGSGTSLNDIMDFLQTSLDDVVFTVFKNDVGNEHDSLKALLTGDISEKSMKEFFNADGNRDYFFGLNVLYLPHHGSMNNGRLLYNLLDVYSPVNDIPPLVGIISSDPNAGTSDRLPKLECLQYSSVRHGEFSMLKPHDVTVDGGVLNDYSYPLYITCNARGSYYKLESENNLWKLLDEDGVLLSN